MHSQKVDFQVRYTGTWNKLFKLRISTKILTLAILILLSSPSALHLANSLSWSFNCNRSMVMKIYRFNQVNTWYQYEKIILVNDHWARYSRLQLLLTLNLWTSSCNLSLSCRISLYSSPELWKWLTFRQDTKSFCYYQLKEIKLNVRC